MEITTKLVGEKEIIKKIELLKKKHNEELRKIIEKSCIIVEARAKKGCPHVTNRLRASITYEVKTVDKDHQGRVGTPVFYGPYVEFGTGVFAEGGVGRKTAWLYYNEKLDKFFWTVGMLAQPFLLPALKNSRSDIIGLLTKALKGIRT